MTSKETKLEEILLNINKPEVSLKKLGSYYLEAKEILGAEATSKEFELALFIFQKGSLIIGEFMTKWMKKSIRPNDEELDLLEKAFDEGSKVFNFFEEKSLITKESNEINQKKLQDCNYMVQQEKKVRRLEKEMKDKQNSSQSSQNSSPENDSASNLNIQKNNSQEIQALQSQIISLQSSIKSLEASKNFSDDREKKLENLKQQLANLQNELQSLQSKSNKPNSNNNSSRLRNSNENSNEVNSAEPKKDFPWVIVAPLGITVVIFGIIIAYLLGKKSKVK